MNIYKIVEYGFVDHWVIAHTPDEAIKEIKATGMCDEDATFECEILPLQSELTLHMDALQKGITHTVHDWLLIHNYKKQYLACSEY